jgi:RNA polymerase sigma-70 factor, ECF subfamily
MQKGSTTNVTDQELVTQVVQGNASAYGHLYDRYIEQIYRYIYFQTMNQHEAEDLTETAFLKTYEILKEDGSKITNFKAWLYRIAHNLVIDLYRSRSRAVFVSLHEDMHDSLPPPETTVLDKENYRDLFVALEKLDPQYRQVITCRFINGLSHDEVAQIMQLKPNHLRVIQFRALQKLRELLSEKDFLE